MSFMNKLGVIDNPYQKPDQFKRVLTVCSAGCLRSPTAAVVLAGEPYNFNTRAAGCTDEYAIVKVDDALLVWADEVVFMEAWQKDNVARRFDLGGKELAVLDIPDRFAYRDPELIEMIKTRYDEVHK